MELIGRANALKIARAERIRVALRIIVPRKSREGSHFAIEIQLSIALAPSPSPSRVRDIFY